MYVLNLTYEKDKRSTKDDLTLKMFKRSSPQVWAEEGPNDPFLCVSSQYGCLRARIPLLPPVPRGRAASLSDSRRQIHSIVFPSIGPDPGGLRQKIQRHNIISEGRTQHRMAGKLDLGIHTGFKTCLTNQSLNYKTKLFSNLLSFNDKT